jgi:uncharacterized membrane protein YbhN (UPF0104 family)
MTRDKLKKIVNWLGTALVVVALVFLVRRLVSADVDWAALASPWVWAALVGISLLEGTGILAAAQNFRAIIKNVTGVVAPRGMATHVYTLSNVYKYIPGGVMYLAGRQKLALEVEGITHPKVVFASAMEAVFTASAAIIFALVLSFDYVRTFVGTLDMGFVPVAMLVVGIILLVAGPLLYIFRKQIVTRLRAFWATVEIFHISVVIRRIAFSYCMMVMWGGSFALVLVLLGQPLPVYMVFTVIGLYLLAWAAGFIFPGAPSGAGIRELVMLMFLSDIVDPGILLVAMVVHRATAMLGDVAAYGVGVLVKGGKTHKTTDE